MITYKRLIKIVLCKDITQEIAIKAINGILREHKNNNFRDTTSDKQPIWKSHDLGVFRWDNTPEGYEFWYDICCGRNSRKCYRW